MELAHAADDGLARVRVGLHGKGRVLLGELAERDAQLVEVLLRLGLHGDTDHGIGELHGLQRITMVLRADRIARAEVLEADRRADVSGLHELDRVLVVGVHLVETGHALLLPGTGIEHVGAGIQVTGIDTDIRQTSHERIGRNLEDKTAERLGRGGLEQDFLVVRQVGRLRRADVQRRREIAHHGIQQELDALVLERGTAAGRNDLHGDGTLAERRDDLLLRNGFGGLEVLVHQGVVALGGGLDQFVAPESDGVLHVRGDVLDS